jgi:hypothetical protein
MATDPIAQKQMLEAQAFALFHQASIACLAQLAAIDFGFARQGSGVNNYRIAELEAKGIGCSDDEEAELERLINQRDTVIPCNVVAVAEAANMYASAWMQTMGITVGKK